MSFLLDTNVVSELRKRQRANAGVQRWFADHEGDDLWLSTLVIGELCRGEATIRHRGDVAAAAAIADWIEALVDDFGDRILPVTVDVARRWGAINVPDPVPVVDGLLAATAMEHDLVLVTRNVADVARTGIDVVDPFD